MSNRPPRDLSELECRRRAAARNKRKKEIRRNRIIFGLVCVALLAVIVFAIVKVTKGLSGQSDGSSQSSGSSGSTVQSSSQDASVSTDSTSQTSDSQGAASTATSDTATNTGTNANDDPLLTLVNANVKMPDDWEANLQTKVADTNTGKELQTEAADAYMTMRDAAAKEGIDLMLCSGYRSVEYQTNLFNQEQQKWLDKGETEEEAYNQAKTVVQVPGYSEHNLGLAADIVTPKHQTLDSAFADTDAGKWLAQHAPEYGFILRYPENKQAITGIIYEPWHFRYVGVENAKAITASGLCLEEYLNQSVNNV